MCFQFHCRFHRRKSADITPLFSRTHAKSERPTRLDVDFFEVALLKISPSCAALARPLAPPPRAPAPAVTLNTTTESLPLRAAALCWRQLLCRALVHASLVADGARCAPPAAPKPCRPPLFAHWPYRSPRAPRTSRPQRRTPTGAPRRTRCRARAKSTGSRRRMSAHNAIEPGVRPPPAAWANLSSRSARRA